MEKKDIALRHLRAAAKLYNSGDYVSSLTLAGAAEEILGKIAKKRARKSELESELVFQRSIYSFIGKAIPDDKTLLREINRVKNELKHNDDGENKWVEADFEYEVCIIFVRALKNYFNAYNEMPKDRTIMRLFEYLTM